MMHQLVTCSVTSRATAYDVTMMSFLSSCNNSGH